MRFRFRALDSAFGALVIEGKRSSAAGGPTRRSVMLRGIHRCVVGYYEDRSASLGFLRRDHLGRMPRRRERLRALLQILGVGLERLVDAAGGFLASGTKSD